MGPLFLQIYPKSGTKKTGTIRAWLPGKLYYVKAFCYRIYCYITLFSITLPQNKKRGPTNVGPLSIYSKT